VAYDPDTGAYLRRSMGRRRSGRPARYYLKLVYHELGEAIKLTARSDEEAVEKARTLYVSPRDPGWQRMIARDGSIPSVGTLKEERDL
jgi:hypothetical protein